MTDASNREEKIVAFLDRAGWGMAKRDRLTADASTRRYERLTLNGQTVLLMDAPPAAESEPCPPGASPDQRLALGYNATARLAGPDSRRFAAFAGQLRVRGLSAPEVIDAEFDDGLLLIEDLGDDLYASLLERGMADKPLYRAAIDLLLELHAERAPQTIGGPGTPKVPLLSYDKLAYSVETDLLPEWLYPLLTGRRLPDEELRSYQAVWNDLLVNVSQHEPVIVLRDYHAENLIWLPDRNGVGRVGLIDFQDGLAGHPAYDVISLLKDARRDVPIELADHMTAHYADSAAEKLAGFDKQKFISDAALLACQRNAKILGIFARLWLRDDKPKYLDFVPRLWRYMTRDLEHPELEPLKAWFDKNFPPSLRVAPAPRQVDL